MTTASRSTFDTDVRLAILRAFIEGGPTPTVQTIASDLAANPDDVAAAFERLAAGRVILLAPGTRDIMMSAPFAGRPTGRIVPDPEGVVAHFAVPAARWWDDLPFT
jgi:hypothetical protein